MKYSTSMSVLLSVLVGLAFLLAFATGPASAAPVLVDDDNAECSTPHNTIQEGINAADPGDIILVCNGDYNSTIVNKSVSLADANGSAVINGSGRDGTALTISASNVTIAGFEIKNFNGTGNFSQGHGALLIQAGVSNVTVVDNRFAGLQGSGVFLGSLSSTPATDLTVRNNTFDNISNSSIAIANAENVSITDNTINGTANAAGTPGPSGLGIAVFSTGEGNDATVSNVTIADNDLTGPFLLGIEVAATTNDTNFSATMSDITVTNNTLEDAGLISIDASATGPGSQSVDGLTITENTVDSSFVGISLSPSDASTLSNVLVNDNTVNDTVIGFDAGASDNSSLSAVNVSENLFPNNTFRAMQLEAVPSGTTSQTGTLSNVTVFKNGLNGSSGTGLAVDSGGGGTVSGISVSRNLIENNSADGILFNTDDEATLDNVFVFENRIANNTNGTRVTASTAGEGLEIQRNVIANNSDFGVGVSNNSTLVNARLNFWGDSSGPASQSATLADPISGALADGTGDNVTEGSPGSDVSNVIFDPWIGKPTCQEDEILNVSGLVNQGNFTVGNVTIEQNRLAPVCGWQWSLLPFKTTQGSAATSVDNLNMFGRSGNGGDQPLNRTHISVYHPGEAIDLGFSDVEPSANTSRFAGDDVQLVAIKPDRGNISGISLDTSFNNTTGAVTLSTQSDVDALEVLDDSDVGALGPDGDTRVSFTPEDPGTYLFALVRVDYGEGFSSTSDDRLTLDGGATILGLEVAQVHDARSFVSTTHVFDNDTVFSPGENVTFNVNANLGQDESIDHSILLYDADSFQNERVITRLNNSTGISDLLNVTVNDSNVTVRFNLSNVTLRRSIAALQGVARVEGGTFLGVDVASQDSEGRINVSLTPLLTNEFVTSPPDEVVIDDTVIEGSATAIDSTAGSRVINVSTLDNISTGEYRFVHVATGGSVSTNTGTVTIQQPSQATPTPAPAAEEEDEPGGGGGGGGGGALFGFESDIRIVSATLQDVSVGIGEPVVVRVTLENQGDLSGDHEVRLFANGEFTGDAKFVRVSSGEQETVDITTTFDQAGTFEIAANNETAGTVAVTGAETPTATVGPEETPPGTMTAGPRSPTPTPFDTGIGPAFIGIVILVLLALISGGLYYLYEASGPGGIGGNPPGE